MKKVGRLWAIALSFFLISCGKGGGEEEITPEKVLFLGRTALFVEDGDAEQCAAAAGDRNWNSCRQISYDLGWGDTARLWWVEYADQVASWKNQLESLDSTALSLGKIRLIVRLPNELAFPAEALYELRLQWPSSSRDGGALYDRFSLREADHNGDGLQSGYLLGVPLAGEWICRRYRSGALDWCWSREIISAEDFRQWRQQLPLEERGENEWFLLRDGRAIWVAEQNGRVGMVSGVLSPDSLSIILSRFLSLQAWTK